MAKQRSSFAKLQRDKAKKERAEERLAARKERSSSKKPFEEEVVVETGKEVPVSVLVAGKGEPSPDELLKIVEDLNNRREAGTISVDEFEEAKVELFARLAD